MSIGPSAKISAVVRATGLALMLAGCSQAPQLKLPEVPTAAGWREAGPAGMTKVGQPLVADTWWTIYGDAELDALQQRLLADSPDLAAALARHDQARAASDLLRASQFPSIGAQASLQRNRQSERRPLRVLGPTSPDYYNAGTLGLAIDYEVDVWGRIRDQVAGAQAQRLAAQADLAAARLSLQAMLADSLIVLRGLDRDIALLSEAETAYARAVDLVRRRHEGGASSGLDLARAQAQLQAARSQQRQSRAQRALVEHAIASLLGQSASTFSIAARIETAESPLPAIPAIPVKLPSTLLQRRPDIVAARQRVAAATASVGVASAAWFPAITLNALVGYQSSDFSQLLGAPNLFWALGPTMLANVFDGGRRRSEEARVRAVLDETGARYKATVLTAFQQVEDNLALLDHYGSALADEQVGVAAAERALTIATHRYQQGAASYLEVITAQTTALQARRSAADLATRERRASVQLVRALGGGWEQGALASAPPPSARAVAPVLPVAEPTTPPPADATASRR